MPFFLRFFLFLPYLLILFLFLLRFEYHPLGLDELALALTNSVYQSIVTVIVSIGLGSILFVAIYSLPKRLKPWTILIIVPYLMPALNSLSVYFGWMSTPYFGNLAVGCIQGLSLAGLFAFSLKLTYQQKLSHLDQVSALFNIPTHKYWIQIFRALRSEFIWMLIFAVMTSVSSFSIPLVLGGVDGSNLEVFLFQMLRMDSPISSILQIALLQLIILFGLDKVLSKRRAQVLFAETYKSSQSSHFRIPIIWGVAVVYLFVFAKPLADGVIGGLVKLFEASENFDLLLQSSWNSLYISFLTFMIFIFFFASIAFVFLIETPKARPILSYPISASLLAVAFWPLHYLGSVLLLIFSYLFIFGPFLFRLGFFEYLKKLEEQVIVAKGFGKSRVQILYKIVLPQIKGRILVLSAMAGFWAFMDFAIIRLFITEANFSLAVIAQNWLSSYRYFEAQGLLAVMFLFGMIFIGGIYAQCTQN